MTFVCFVEREIILLLLMEWLIREDQIITGRERVNGLIDGQAREINYIK